jgi:lipoprotein
MRNERRLVREKWSDITIKGAAAIAVVVLWGCEKELDFKYRDVPAIPVIEAYVDQSHADIAVGWTTPMDEPLDTLPAENVLATLTETDSGRRIALTRQPDGHFTAPVAYRPGAEYRLEVELDGKSFHASGTMAEAVTGLELEFGWIKMPYDHVAVLKTSFHDLHDEPGDRYWIRVNRNGEFYKWVVTDDSGASKDRVESVMMTSRMDTEKEDESDVLRKGDIVEVSVTPVSRAMADYLEAIANDSNGPAMFDGPLCLGYFLVAPVTSATILFDPDNMDYY